MMAQKEESISFKCDEAFKAWLQKQAFEQDRSASDIIRACLILAMPQVRKIRGLDRICLEDIRD